MKQTVVIGLFFSGPDILCWSTDLFPKEPQSGKTCAWHQDATYVGKVLIIILHFFLQSIRMEE